MGRQAAAGSRRAPRDWCEGRPKTKAIDIDPVASWYDLYVDGDFDLPFWVAVARRNRGPRLEVMCGTGRISLAVLRAGLELTCVDYSVGMLEVLRVKLAREGLSAPVLENDARALGFEEEFAFAFIGFHSFSELLTSADQRAAAGFKPVAEWGGYDESPFDSATSPYFLAEVERA